MVTFVAVVAFVTAVEPICPTISEADATETALVPAPLSSAPDVNDVAPVPPFATGKVPVTPVVNGRPVAFVNVADDGVPRAGVTNVGLLANTKAPEPVSPVTAAAKFALDGVAKNVATPVPKPEIPVATGNAVQLVSVPDEGVPKAGVTKVEEVSVPPATVGEIKCVFCWAKFVPSLHTVIVLPAGIATPVPAAVVLPMTVEL